MEKETVELINRAGDKIDSVLATLADKLGVATEHFYPVFVKQQYIHGFGSLAITIIAVTLASVLTVKVVRTIKSLEKEGFMPDRYVCLCIFTGIVCLGAACCVGSFFDSGFAKILNPEFYALKDIMELIK